LVLNSDFDARKLDTSIWRAGWFGTGRTASINGNETACYDSRNVSFPGDGTVHLAVTATPSTCDGVTKPYTGAIISTNPDDGRASGGFQYTYGVLEAKVYMPSIRATIANWPSVVALGQRWPFDGENDIMEALNGAVCFHFHSPMTPVHSGAGLCDTAVTPGWHTFAADWAPGSMTYYYDGNEVVRVTKGVTSAPMYIIAVNTTSVRFPDVVKPAAMRIAYIRVWQPVGAIAARRGYKYRF
jgi:beta-glucanase (GH16 family)